MKHLICSVFIMILLCSFQKTKTLTGTWEFRGGLLNGKPDEAPKGYKLQRHYNDLYYTAYLLEKGQKTEKYESGKYRLSNDTCLETQTYCSQPTKLLGVTVHYTYKVRRDTLFLQAKLPNGNIEEDYWKRIK